MPQIELDSFDDPVTRKMADFSKDRKAPQIRIVFHDIPAAGQIRTNPRIDAT